MDKVKRTYNLSPETVRAVRELAGVVAPTQDAVIERSVREMGRQVRDAAHTAAWSAAAQDPRFRQELRELSDTFAGDDQAGWERS